MNVMAHYRFNLHNSIGFVPDEEGRELAGLDEARAEAVKGVRSLVAEDALQGCIDLRGKLEVVDEGGAIVLTVLFGDAVEVLS